MTAMTRFLYDSLSRSLKYDTWLLGVISFTIPSPKSLKYDLWLLWIISLSQLLKYATWQLGTISFTIPYQNLWNMIYDCYDPFPLQFLIKVVEIGHLAARGNFLYNSLAKSLKYDIWLLWPISFTIPYQNHWNMTPGC